MEIWKDKWGDHCEMIFYPPLHHKLLQGLLYSPVSTPVEYSECWYSCATPQPALLNTIPRDPSPASTNEIINSANSLKPTSMTITLAAYLVLECSWLAWTWPMRQACPFLDYGMNRTCWGVQVARMEMNTRLHDMQIWCKELVGHWKQGLGHWLASLVLSRAFSHHSSTVLE